MVPVCCGAEVGGPALINRLQARDCPFGSVGAPLLRAGEPASSAASNALSVRESYSNMAHGSRVFRDVSEPACARSDSSTQAPVPLLYT